MVLKFSARQFDSCDALARQAFFDDMRASLYAHHGDFDGRDQLFESCETTADHLGLQTEQALFAYFDMSFALEMPLADRTDFAQQQSAYIRRFGNPDRLVLELYDQAD